MISDNQKNIESRYLALETIRIEASKKLAELSVEVQDICEHSIVSEYYVNNDNGYGTWWKTKMKRCLICGHEERADGLGKRSN